LRLRPARPRPPFPFPELSYSSIHSALSMDSSISTTHRRLRHCDCGRPRAIHRWRWQIHGRLLWIHGQRLGAELQGGPCGPRTTLRSAQPKPIHVLCTGELIVYIAWPAFWNRDSRETDGSRILLRTARVRPSRSNRAQGAATPRGPRVHDGKR